MTRLGTKAAVAGLGLLLGAWALAQPKAPPAGPARQTAKPAPAQHKSATMPKGGPALAYCAGEYADDLAVLAPRVRDYEQRQSNYTFCVRTSATYECPYYGSDGSLKRSRKKVLAHGTAFAYKLIGGETLLLTNQHVADWPAVTDDEHEVDDVPDGCKRVEASLRIVDNESDDFDRDDIPLGRVVADPLLDVAVLKAKAQLPILPWRVGRSEVLRERNVVEVRGFPLGVFKTVTVGKVISAREHDEDKDWQHEDFVVDAQLSPGNSGSPVFAVSCKTGEFELVGIFHARYSRGSGLNMVVGIDQVRDLMTTLKRTPRPIEPAPVQDAKARAALWQAAVQTEPWFPFGPLTAGVRARPDGALVFVVLAKDFPWHDHALLVLEDLPPQGRDPYGTLGRVGLGGRDGLHLLHRKDLDAEGQSVMAKVLDALRKDAASALAWRQAAHKAATSREQFHAVTQQEKALRRLVTGRQELATAAMDLAEKHAPGPGETGARLVDVLLAPAPAVGLAGAPTATVPRAAGR